MANTECFLIKDMHNDQRLDQRLKALNTSVKIRRRGVGFNQWRYDLVLLDLSANGMALVSPGLKLEPLQKIDFELSSGQLNSCGGAVVCYAGNSENKHRYGLLFIETDNHFDAFLTGESLSSNELTRLGEEMAEQYMYQRSDDRSDLFRLHNQRMVDAVRAMARRLGQMGLYIFDDHGQIVLPAEALVVHKLGGLSLPMPLSLSKEQSIPKVPLGSAGTRSEEIVMRNISLLIGNADKSPRYQIDGGDIFNNIIDLLNHLCLCFDKISIA